MNPNQLDEAFSIFWKASKLKNHVRQGVAFDIFRMGIWFAESNLRYGFPKTLEMLKDACK